MDFSDLSYSKSNKPKRNIKQLQHIQIAPKQKIKNKIQITASSSYEKTEGRLSQDLIFVISGGVRRERDILKELESEKYSVRIIFLSKESQGLLPDQMQEKWNKIQKDKQILYNGKMYSLNKMDKVYLISDVDEFYDKLKIIINNSQNENQTKSSNEGQWIISNPCIEMWLYYCYKNAPEEDLVELMNFPATKRSQELKKLGNILVPGGMNPRKSFERLKEGIKNSKEHYYLDENNIPVLFATQMHLMFEYILTKMEANNNEYEKMLKKKERLRVSFKKGVK